MKGKVVSIKPIIKNTRLRISGKIDAGADGCFEALLPAREMAALLPRHILLGKLKTAPMALLETIQSIVSRLTVGRIVRLWRYDEEYYFSFIQWSDVRFEDGQANTDSSAPLKSQKLQRHSASV